MANFYGNRKQEEQGSRDFKSQELVIYDFELESEFKIRNLEFRESVEDAQSFRIF